MDTSGRQFGTLVGMTVDSSGQVDGNSSRDRKFSSDGVHGALFPKAPKTRSLAQLKAGVRRHLKSKHQTATARRHPLR